MQHTERTHTNTEQTQYPDTEQPQHRTTHLYAQLFTHIVFILLFKSIYQKTL